MKETYYLFCRSGIIKRNRPPKILSSLFLASWEKCISFLVLILYYYFTYFISIFCLIFPTTSLWALHEFSELIVSCKETIGSRKLISVTAVIIVQLPLKCIRKKNSFSHKTAPDFTRWRILHWMETRFTSVDAIYRFIQRKTGSGDIFVITTEHMWMCVRHLSIVDISWAKGLKIITNKLDEIYLRDPNTRVYMAFKEFYSNKREHMRSPSTIFIIT